MASSPKILVTATSFMKSASLKTELELRFPDSKIHYLDLRLPEQLLIFNDPSFTQNLDAWLVGGEPVTAYGIDRMPNLKAIAKYGVGVDNIDFAACASRGVRVIHEPGVNSLAVAEHSLGMIIGLCRNINQNAKKLSAGVWNKDGGRGLSGMKVGIIGLGHVGSKLAPLLKMLGAEIAYAEIVPKPELEIAIGIQRLAYDDLLSWAELLSFHVPLTDQTRKMFGDRELSLTNKGVFLINTARGGIFDEETLKKGLKSGQIAGVALDVFENEPLHDKELAESERLLGTPHTAGNSLQAVEAMGRAAIRGLAHTFSN
ncbi:MAG: hydroxyacid dehydrogenase [Proteobacteria bacterium]|nr:MAG: hydroxyacid dehydrogenase [Pseudomonadota bacterium]